MNDHDDDLLGRRERSDWRMRPRFEPQPPPRERQLDTAQIDWERRIGEVIAHERQFQHDVLIGVIAELRAEASNDLERATRSLVVELADLRATLRELRLVLAGDRSTPVDLPALPARHEFN
jgi:hypothetical protein